MTKITRVGLVAASLLGALPAAALPVDDSGYWTSGKAGFPIAHDRFDIGERVKMIRTAQDRVKNAFVNSKARALSCLPAEVTDTFYPLSLGFYRPNEIDLPPQVKAALASVFEIYVPDDPEIASMREPDPIIITELNKAVRKLCLNGESGLCDFEATRYGRASGFIFAQANILETADHVVRPFIDMMRKKGLETPGSIPIVIRRGNDYQTLAATIQSGNASARPTKWDRLADHVRLTLDRDLGPPLQAGEPNSVRYADDVFVAGYPGKTRNRQLYDRPDATGGDLMVSRGQRVDPYNAFRSLYIPEADICADMKNIEGWKDRYLFVSADASVGNSGGPMLNSDGKVVGILTGTASDLQAIANGGAAVSEFMIHDEVSPAPDKQ